MIPLSVRRSCMQRSQRAICSRQEQDRRPDS